MFRERLAETAALAEARLIAQMAGLADLPVVEAMRYAVRGGKGLRAFLVIEGARLHGVADGQAAYAAAAIEAVHAYSLVHDDLPCMDDDDLRRGRPTVHVKWDEATAVLAGDALQSLAFELLSDPAAGAAEVTGPLIHALARAGGAAGMVGGQALDIAAETAGRPLTIEEITVLQAQKTGALIEWACCAGPRLGRADAAPMAAYAQALGLAFQIADDILDVEGDASKAGKRLQKDAEAGKATFVSLLGAEGAKRRARDLVTEAVDALAPYGPGAENLREAARFVISREF